MFSLKTSSRVVVLGSMIAGGAVSAAQAADLPVAPEPIDYVRVCDAYGTTFYYIPGTDTCLRVGGRLRADYYVNNFGDGPNSWDQNEEDGYSFLGRGYLYLDSRTATEYGLLRTFASIYATASGGEGSSTVEYAFIQFGGFTFGLAQSQWDFWTGYSFGAQLTDYSDTKTVQAAYTAAFGNGFSATLSVEDSTYRETDLITEPAFQDGYAGTRTPDLVANFRIDQGWGSAQIMGALHQVDYLDANGGDTELGWAVGGGVEINLPLLGADDAVVFQVSYSDGASRFPLDTWDDRITDSINLNGKSRTTETWNFSGGFSHNFTSTFQGNLEGGYHIADAGFDAYDFTQWGVTGNVVWMPVSGLEVGTELQYREVDYDSASGPDFDDHNELWATFRVQRTF